jgi:hypothetical protein
MVSQSIQAGGRKESARPGTSTRACADPGSMEDMNSRG